MEYRSYICRCPKEMTYNEFCSAILEQCRKEIKDIAERDPIWCGGEQEIACQPDVANCIRKIPGVYIRCEVYIPYEEF